MSEKPDYEIVSTLTIEENIALPLKLNKFDPETTNQTVDRLLEHVGLLDRKKSLHLSRRSRRQEEKPKAK